jgi:hypothetical protein
MAGNGPVRPFDRENGSRNAGRRGWHEPTGSSERLEGPFWAPHGAPRAARAARQRPGQQGQRRRAFDRGARGGAYGVAPRACSDIAAVCLVVLARARLTAAPGAARTAHVCSDIAAVCMVGLGPPSFLRWRRRSTAAASLTWHAAAPRRWAVAAQGGAAARARPKPTGGMACGLALLRLLGSTQRPALHHKQPCLRAHYAAAATHKLMVARRRAWRHRAHSGNGAGRSRARAAPPTRGRSRRRCPRRPRRRPGPQVGS